MLLHRDIFYLRLRAGYMLLYLFLGECHAEAIRQAGHVLVFALSELQ
jgi:hypothetical protein